MDEFKQYVNKYIGENDNKANDLAIFFMMKSNEIISGGHNDEPIVNEVNLFQSTATVPNHIKKRAPSSIRSAKNSSFRFGKKSNAVVNLNLEELLKEDYNFNNYKKIYNYVTKISLPQNTQSPSNITNRSIDKKMPTELKSLWEEYKTKMSKKGGTRKIRLSRRRR